MDRPHPVAQRAPAARMSPARRWRALCLLSAGITLGLTAAVLWWGVLPGEAGLRTAIRGLAAPGLLALAQAVSDVGTWRGLVPATLALLALSAAARRRWWLWSGLLVLTPLVGEGWQELVGRPRPHGAALGLPSGHAVAIATFALFVCYVVGRSALSPSWRIGLATLVLGTMVAVGLARIVRDAHWAADVVVGFALGAAGAAAAAWWDLTHPGRPPAAGDASARSHLASGARRRR
jgi:membrane-associated phospholipid phosphatase